ncbi:MAG: Exopolyphosphatase 2 [Ignavibacteriaceae bacterium]|nr:Exopolyphosphatase 2 [Ignavibacteriaceae bacterium]
MPKIASIDIGTNTALMLISEYNGRRFSFFEDYYEIPRIGQGVANSGVISDQKAELLKTVLLNFKKIAEQKGVERFLISGTNAFRIAQNSSEVIAKVKSSTNLEIQVLSGEEEARLSYLGATWLNEGENFIVIDIGGGSTELINGTKNKISQSVSLPLGVVALTESFGRKVPPVFNDMDKLQAEVYKVFKNIPLTVSGDEKVIAVAGTPTTLAAIKAGLTVYDENSIEGFVLNTHELQEFSKVLNNMSSDEILSNYPIVKGREDVITAGNIILSMLCNYLGIKEIQVSTRGLRYGMLFEYVRSHSQTLTE